jgi:hypothetical protein
MMPNKTSELRELYFQQNRYTVKTEDQAPPFLELPEAWTFQKLKPDVKLLSYALNSPVASKADTALEQVFGTEIKRQHIKVEHIANLFAERCQIHRSHLDEIGQRHLEFQGKKYGQEINNFPDKAKRVSSLETMLGQLEKERREEELAFWKDTMELREKILEGVCEYNDAKQRCQILSDVEARYGR